MSDTVPPIPPPFGANTGNPSSLIRAGNPSDNINSTTINNVAENIVDENLPQLLDSRGGFHGPSEIKDTKIAALRLKFNAFKALEGEKVNGTFKRLKCLLNDLENNGVSFLKLEDSNSDVEKDQMSSNEFLADLNAEFHERALHANQRRFYKEVGRVAFSKGTMDMCQMKSVLLLVES
ncbi:hypothetical protein Tco_1326433 [Tanacetum coccineum]